MDGNGGDKERIRTRIKFKRSYLIKTDKIIDKMLGKKENVRYNIIIEKNKGWK